MLASNTVHNQLPSVLEFYDGKSVFLTGVSGFVGSVLLETLLRCCPGIMFIYTLLRTKKNMLLEDRKKKNFNKKIFEKMRRENPELLEKVRLISGDASLPNLGMNEDDKHLLFEEVSIVFHCAAVVNFKKPLEILLINNVLSLSRVIELCRKMRKFEVLVYTSAAYSNSNHLHFALKEEVYRLPFHAKQFLNALRNEDKEKLQELIAHCKPDWPNLYEFSKCLAENVIADTASDLRVAIIRPSIVFSTWKHPIPGYLEENFGITIFSLGVGKGFIKVANADPKCKVNLVPADVVANAHVLAAWSLGTKRCASPFVVNCTATENLHVTLAEYSKAIRQLVYEFPLPGSFQQDTYLIIVPCKYVYYIFAAYYHYLPAIVLDGMLRILRKKPKIYSLYRFFDKMMDSLNFFVFHTFEFERNNLECLNKLIHKKEKKDLTLDFSEASLLGMILSFPEGSPFYDWKSDKKSPRERQKIKYRRYLLISCIQMVFLMACCLLIYWLLFCIFL